MTSRKQNILFLCTGNSCRSQMAEGFGRDLKGSAFNFYSAGTETHGLNPRAVKVMSEAGVDISHHQSKTLESLSDVKLDYVITVCGHAHENCPYIAKGKILHHGFDDPPFLSKDLQSEEEILAVYRRVRDEIKSFVLEIESNVLQGS